MHLARRRWPVVAALALVVTLAAVDPGVRLALEHALRFSTLTRIRTYVHHLGVWGPFALMAIILLHGVTFVPAEVLTLAALWVYGPVWGLVYAWTGSMLSAYAAFYLARWLGRPLASRYVPPKQMARLDAIVAREGARGLFVLRLIPLVSFNALNYASGLTKLTFWQYTWATGLGILPSGIVLALLYRSVARSHSAFLGLAVLGLGLLFLLVVRIRRRGRGRAAPGPGDP